MEEKQYFENSPFSHEIDDWTENKHYHSRVSVSSVIML